MTLSLSLSLSTYVAAGENSDLVSLTPRDDISSQGGGLSVSLLLDPPKYVRLLGRGRSLRMWM